MGRGGGVAWIQRSSSNGYGFLLVINHVLKLVVVMVTTGYAQKTTEFSAREDF